MEYDDKMEETCQLLNEPLLNENRFEGHLFKYVKHNASIFDCQNIL